MDLSAAAMLWNQGLWVVVRRCLLWYQLLVNIITADSIRGLIIPQLSIFCYEKVHTVLESYVIQ